MRFGKLLLLLFASNLCLAQVDRIAGPIDVSQKVALPGNVHPLARPEYDQGAVDPSLKFGSVTLEIAPSPAQQAALDQLLADQQNRNSPSYHKWLMPEQYADRFGLTQKDMDQITAWLQLQGFSVVRVARGRNAVVFSGSAAQIQSVFNTELHRYNVSGEKHIANATVIEVPEALSGVVTSVRGLNNFRPKPMYVRAARGAAKGPHPHYTTTIQGQTDYFIAPGDIATLYDINPLYTAATPIDGTGQQLAIIGQTDIYLADLNDFRSGFGLSTIPSSCTTDSSGVVVAPCNTANFNYILVGTDEGVSPLGDIVEADLDLEWSGAVARNAQIVFVNAPVNSTETVGGVNIALQYAIDNNVAPVISMSYGICEAFAESLETELQQANAQGITVMNSSGDTGSFACDNGPPGGTSTSAPSLPYGGAVNGIAVNYPASSPEVTGVGGTSIPSADYTSAFWNTNASGTVENGGSALGYIPEAAWNDDPAFALFCQGNPTSSFCENGGSNVPGWVALGTKATAQQVQENIWINAGGGGISNCYGETQTGICTSGFTRPTYQSGISISGVSANVRFVPDVSLLASPNYPGYIICTPMNALTGSGSNTSSCASGILTAVDTNFSLIGGTSASTPVFAGIVTLINQYLGTAGLGNINPTLYSLATTAGNFHPVTNVGGNNDVYCQAGTPTGQPSTPAPGVICPNAGVAGFSASVDDSKTKYNLVTGLGSVDVNNLATAWKASRTGTPTVTITSPTVAQTVWEGASVTFTASVTPTTAVGAVSFSTLNSITSTTSVVGSASLNTPYPQTSTGTATFTTTSLPAGMNTVSATYEGDASSPGSAPSATAPAVTVMVPYTLSASPATFSIPAGSTATSIITITPMNGFSGAVNFSCASGLPTGVTCSFNQAGSVSLSGTTAQQITLSITTLPNMAQVSAIPITINAASSSPAALVTTTLTLTVAATNETVTLSTTANTFTVGVGGTVPVQLTVGGANGFINTSNKTTIVPLTYSCSGTPSLATAEISCQPQNNGQPTNATTVTVNLVTTPVTAQLHPPMERHRIFYAALLPGILGIAFLRPRLCALRFLGLFLALALSTLWLAACGGHSNNPGPGQQPNGGTPAGNYTVTITATTGGAVPLTASKTITLSVSANQ